jgi:predicted phage terminase large subunit-like protein
MERLTEEELIEYQDLLEGLLLEKQRTNVIDFAKNIEIPGAPTVDDDTPSDIARRLENREWTPPPEYADVEFYTEKTKPALHHELILATIQDLLDDKLVGPNGEEVDGVLIQAPPGSAKSSYASMVLPAFVMGYRRKTNVIGASFAQELADRFSRRVRSITDSAAYARIFPEARPMHGNSAVRGWALSNGSEYRSTGVGAGIAGFRCLPGESIVVTSVGPMRIDVLFNNPRNYEVLSYDEQARRPVYRRVIAAARSQSNDIWRVRTAAGRVVESTGNHPFYTGRGWVEASAIAVGDVLLRAMRKAGAAPSLRGCEENSQVLLRQLRNHRHECSAGASREEVSTLRGTVRDERYGRSPRRAGVLKGVLECHHESGWGQAPAQGEATRVRGMREIIHPKEQFNTGSMLLSGMHGSVARIGAKGGRQSELEGWEVRTLPREGSGDAGVHIGLQTSAVCDHREGSALRPVWWVAPQDGGSSYGPEPEKSRHEEFSSALPEVSQRLAQGGTPWGSVVDAVVSVERVPRDCYVYDIQVEETECFFANDVLVHNCNVLILDDLIANRAEAESPLIREKIWNAVNDDLLPRAKGDFFKIIGINTRFHENDHFGRFLGEDHKGQSGFWRGANGRNWWVINLPLHAEHADDPLHREFGDLLWPEWYKERQANLLRDDKTPQGIRRYSSLYQQRPAPNEGSILLRQYWRPWGKLVQNDNGVWMNTEQPPECEFLMISYDTAIEDGQDNDASAATVWGIFETVTKGKRGKENIQRGAIMLGAWQDRIQAVDLIRQIEKHVKLFKPDLILIEKRASGAQLIQELKRRRWPVKAFLPKGPPGTKGKVPRANAISYVLEAGSVWYYPMHKSMVTTTPDDVIDQCSAFPNAAHDDLVDTVTAALAFFRDKYLLNVESDLMTDEEEEEDDRRKVMSQYSGRRLYGSKSANTTDRLSDRVRRGTQR